MNHLYVLTACLAASVSTVALHPPKSPPQVAARAAAATIRGHTSWLPESPHAAGASAAAKAHPLIAIEQMTKVHRKTVQQTQAWAEIGWEYSLLQQAVANRSVHGAIVTLIVLITLGVCLIGLLVGGRRQRPPDWTMSSAQDLLNKPGQDPRLPGSGDLPPAQSDYGPPLAPPPPAQSGPAVGGLMNWAESLFSGTQAPVASSVAEPVYLMPEFVVQDPAGARIFIDGEMKAADQNATVVVWKAASERDHVRVMILTFCEGTADSNGVTVDLPSNQPVAFLNTEYSSEAPIPGDTTAFSSNCHITIYDTSASGALDLRYPFAKVEREAHGCVVRRVSGEVLCIVQAGGYNTDFANITDENGKLIATLSTKGHSLTGLGMVRGAWTKDRRVLQVGQGVDLMLMVLASVCATKLG